MIALNWCIFRKTWVVCQQRVLKFILDFVSNRSANFQRFLDCFIPNFKLKYEDSENIKADRFSTVVFNLHQIKRRAFILGHPVSKALPTKVGRVPISIDSLWENIQMLFQFLWVVVL